MTAAAESLQCRLQLVLDEKCGPLSADQLSFLKVAAREGQRLLEMIGDLKVLMLDDSSVLELDQAPCDMAAFVREAVERSWPRAITGQKEIELSIGDSALTMGDAPLLERAVLRLVQHAATAAARGSTIHIALDARELVLRFEVDELPTDALAIGFASSVANLHGGALSGGLDDAGATLAFGFSARDRLTLAA